MRQTFYEACIKILTVGVAAIFVVAPFYAPLSVWAASRLQHFELLKILEEIVLAVLAAVLFGFLLTYRRLIPRLLANRLLILIGVYALLLIGTGIYDLASHRVATKAVINGWLLDLSPVGFFSVVLLTAALTARRYATTLPWRKLVIWPALAVIVFGFLQFTVLPKNSLSHIGYGPDTIAAYETVDNQPNIVRIQSSLRGPNPLGAYLVLIIPLLLVAASRFKDQRRWWWLGFSLLGLVVLFGSYSRSAEVGLLLSLVVLAALRWRRRLSRQVLVTGAALLLALIGGLAIFRHSYFVQNVVFHSSGASSSPMSANAERNAAIKRAASDVYHHPLGGGIGSAGPASRRNTGHDEKIAENYYLQIGQEVGWAGLLLFVAIVGRIAIKLWRQRRSALAQVLLAALVGLSFINLFAHAWADETLAYVWWGLAGIALAPAILKSRAKAEHEKK